MCAWWCREKKKTPCVLQGWGRALCARALEKISLILHSYLCRVCKDKGRGGKGEKWKGSAKKAEKSYVNPQCPIPIPILIVITSWPRHLRRPPIMCRPATAAHDIIRPGRDLADIDLHPPQIKLIYLSFDVLYLNSAYTASI